MFPSARFPALKRISFRGGRDRREDVALPSAPALQANLFQAPAVADEAAFEIMQPRYRGHAVAPRFAPKPIAPRMAIAGALPDVEIGKKERLGAFDWRHYGAEPSRA